MMKREPRETYWFRAKRYGWGWTPCSWQGWSVLAVWASVFTAFVLGAAAAAASSDAVVFAAMIALAVVSTLVLVYVGWRSGERPGWHWGER
jgi:hypothetical protein